ncbi:MAG TPA: SHOCT domain-containing protein [Galbitalea sp.]|nr:SHOCT domain-containing protein [Galbitalea sp.]
MAINIIFAVVFGVIVVALVIWIVTIYRRARRVSDASDARLNSRLYAAVAELPEVPQGAPTQAPTVAPKPLADPVDAAPSGPKESRLAELADLHARGLITDEELTTARAKVLAE